MSHEALETAETIERLTHPGVLRQLIQHATPGIYFQPDRSLNCLNCLNCLNTPMYTRWLLRHRSASARDVSSVTSR